MCGLRDFNRIATEPWHHSCRSRASQIGTRETPWVIDPPSPNIKYKNAASFRFHCSRSRHLIESDTADDKLLVLTLVSQQINAPAPDSAAIYWYIVNPSLRS